MAIKKAKIKERTPVTVKTLGEYISAVKGIQDKWSENSSDMIYPWFRGLSNKKHSLLPSLYRSRLAAQYEDSFRDDFKLKAPPYLDAAYQIPNDEWEWYFLMQHYGLPTRLLDWTEGSLIALFFALQGGKDSISSPCVWVLNPFKINNHNPQLQREKIYHYKEDDIQTYLPRLWSNASIPSNPISITPNYNSKRLAAQKGCFTVHGDNRVGLETLTYLNGHLVCIEIDKGAIDGIKTELRTSGINHALIYPELSGLSREISDFYLP